MKAFDIVTAVLLIVGGLNWGLWGGFHYDLVASLLGGYTPLSRVVYLLVGVSAVYQAVAWGQIQRRWHGVPATAR